MEVLWFLLGVVVGGGVVGLVVSRQSDIRVAEVERRVERDLRQAQANADDADLAHRETKERLIALQQEHQALAVKMASADANAASTMVPTPVAPVPAPAPVAARGDMGDLKRIKGIGPALERRLNGFGIKTLAELAALSAADVERLNGQLDFPGRIQRERWIEQAKALLGG